VKKILPNFLKKYMIHAMNKKYVIAIDGPAASGKSTTAKAVATALGYVYIDTGAMYRAVALHFLQHNLSQQDCPEARHAVDMLDIQLDFSADGVQVFLNGDDVSEQIRQPEVSQAASNVSQFGFVRSKLVALQQAMGEQGGVVMDGRDIGTVVFPHADFKFFMLASLEERAKRRFLELQKRGVQVLYEDVLAEISRRDQQDSSRALAPLQKAEDAIEIDTTKLNIAEQVERILHYIQG